jgi:hypothetical protein
MISYNSSIVTSGLVLCLDAGNPRSYPGSGTSWYDASGNRNTCSLINGPVYTSSLNGYFTFDGVDEYGQNAASPNNFNFSTTNAISADAWIYYSPSNYDFWFTSTVSSVIKYRFGTNSAGNFYWDMGQHADKTYAGYVLPSNTWCYVAFTGGLEAGSIVTRIYANGTLITSLNEGISTLADTNDFFIGTGEGASVHPFNGRIAITRVYNRVLSATEVLQNFNAQRGRYGV